MTIQLSDSISGLVGGKTAAALKRAFQIDTVEDLLRHYPRRYLKRGELSPIADLPVGEQVTIVAEVRSVRTRGMRAKRGEILEVVISDGDGLLTLTFFNQSWRAVPGKPGSISVGDRGLFSGKVSSFRGALQLTHPEYEIFDSESDGISAKTGHSLDPQIWATQPVPIYSATAKLPSWQIAKAIALVLDGLAEIPDVLPASVRETHQLLEYEQALRMIHQPEVDSDHYRARHTLAFMEAYVLQLSLLKRKRDLHGQPSIARLASPNGYRAEFEIRLPFELTPDQQQVSSEIAEDLAQPHPMNRLLHGEVGSGKTLVALLAMLTVADSGGQSALLVPTEVLAVQHYRSIVKLLGDELVRKLQPVLLTGQMSTADRKRALLNIVTGTAKIVVGTHALFSEKTQFYDVGLIVIDEQHRFGVDQRESLRAKGENPHLLVLSATPIPRTVAMTIFGDLDVSTIRTMPAKRSGITSYLVPLAEKPAWRERIWQRMCEEVAEGRQVFVVTPAIHQNSEGDSGIDSDTAEWLAEESGLTIATVEETYDFLSNYQPLAELGATVAMLHGQQSAEEKDRIMRAFTANEVQVLVSTTVIEVGVDVPNASLMIVLSADRFGVSQLHQLRGRIGRGQYAGLALFVTEAAMGSLAMERLAAVASTVDGFELAQLDLELRSEGDVLGNRQSGGKSSLKLLRVIRDTEIIEQAKAEVEALLSTDPKLERHPELLAVLQELNEDRADYLQKS